MLFNKRLKRKTLNKIVQDFDKQYKKIENEKEKKKLMNEVLNKLENILNKYNLKKDDRFVTYGRRDFLREEFTNKLNKKFIKTNSDHLLDAY